ncbi:hypothetical protein HNQ84_001808 [Anoxybacillus eryuanensis]
MKDFPIRFVLTDEAITPSPRLAFIVYLLHQTKLDKRVNALRIPTVRREVHISHSDVIRSMMCLPQEKRISIISKHIIMTISFRHQ